MGALVDRLRESREREAARRSPAVTAFIKRSGRRVYPMAEDRPRARPTRDKATLVLGWSTLLVAIVTLALDVLS